VSVLPILARDLMDRFGLACHKIPMEKPTTIPIKRGRPATGRAPTVTLTLPVSLMTAVDQSADRAFEPRASAVRRLLAAGLACERNADATTPGARPPVKRTSDARRRS
jgi:hypothetical protein